MDLLVFHGGVPTYDQHVAPRGIGRDVVSLEPSPFDMAALLRHGLLLILRLKRSRPEVPPKLFQDLLATIQRMQRQMNMAVLLVEQNVREALAIADRAYVMKAGRMVYAGPPSEIDDHAKLMELY